MTTRTASILLLAMLAAACRSPSHPGLDLEGPHLLGTDLVAGQELGPSDPIRLWFSEAVDPGTIREHAIVLVPFVAGDACAHPMSCAEGWRCHRGRCQLDPITAGWLSDLANPPLAAARIRQIAAVTIELDESGAALTLRANAPLAPHRLHALLVGPVRDLAGNLVELPGPGSQVALREVLATGGEERARPSLRLRSPPAGEVAVPPNLARVVIETTRPVRGVSGGSLWLELPSGARVELAPREPSALCGEAAPRTCFELLVRSGLPPLSRVELRASKEITDGEGRPLHEADLPGPGAAAFATAAGVDRVAPTLEALELLVADRCVVVRARGSEASDLVLHADWLPAGPASAGVLRHELGIPAPSDRIGTLELVLGDLAGNQVSIPAGPIDARAPPARIVVSEVLANPAGPEPAQELVELVNLESVAIDLGGFQLDDGGDGIGADVLPPVWLGPGAYAVVVGAKYSLEGPSDPKPAAGALLVRLAGTLGDGGIGNAGERVLLLDPSGRLVSSYGGHHPMTSAASNGQSVERLDLGGCDVASNWRPRPDGRSSPGWPAEGDRPPE